MMTFDELRDRICEDQISEGEVMAALREPLATVRDEDGNILIYSANG